MQFHTVTIMNSSIVCMCIHLVHCSIVSHCTVFVTSCIAQWFGQNPRWLLDGVHINNLLGIVLSTLNPLHLHVYPCISIKLAYLTSYKVPSLARSFRFLHQFPYYIYICFYTYLSFVSIILSIALCTAPAAPNGSPVDKPTLLDWVSRQGTHWKC